MKFIENFRNKYMGNNIFFACLAGVIGVFLWLFISLTQYPSVQKTVDHIPVSVDISGSSAVQNGLSVISCDVEKVTVELLGNRTQIGYLNSETLEAYFDADSVSSPGTKKLTLKVRGENGIKYEVKSISPQSATVVFDKIDTREYPISPLTPNVEVVEGKEINSDEFICEPSVVRITGPSAQLDKISKCYAVSNKKMSLESSYVVTNDDIMLYTEDNVRIDHSSLKFSDMNFNITIPVRTQKTVGLAVSIVNAPENFDQSSIKFKLSADSVTLACNNSKTEIPDTLDFVVSLNEIKPGFTRTFSLSNRLENSEYINVSDLETVTVSLDDSKLDNKNLIIDASKIAISNIPDSSYEYDLLTQQMEITVVGSEESIRNITSEDIIADVNLLNLSITSDQFNQNVAFSCPTYDDVWIVTNSKVSVQRTKIPATTETSIQKTLP